MLTKLAIDKTMKHKTTNTNKMRHINYLVPDQRSGFTAVSAALRKKQFLSGNCLAIVAIAALSSSSASAAVISGLNTDNLVISTALLNTPGVTTIYDRSVPDGSAQTNGRIAFDGSDSDSPGVKIVNDAAPSDPATTGDVDNAIMGTPSVGPNAPQKTHKRLKFQRTGHGTTDLVFDHDTSGTFSNANSTPGDNDGLYKVYMAFANHTSNRLGSFSVTLGNGVGTGFTNSVDADGLSFQQTFGGNPPGNSQFSSFFAHGLFGEIDATHPLLGYFSATRSGFNMAFTGEDSFSSTSLFGDYESLFGEMMSLNQLPQGYFYDDDGDPETDNVLIAHQLADGTWVRNRNIELDGSVTTLAFGDDGEIYATEALLIADLKLMSGLDECAFVTAGTPCLAGSGDIDDLAKFNLTFFVNPTTYAEDQLTLRFGSAVPEPSSTALLGLGGLALMLRRRRKE